MAERTGRQLGQVVKSVMRALDVLDYIADEDGAKTLSEIARRSSLSKTATFNILATLEQRGLVARDQPRGGYRLGWRVFELGASARQQSDLLRVAKRHCVTVAQQTGETVMLGALDGLNVLYVDSTEGTYAVRLVMGAGQRSPLHSTASGRVLLAYSADGLLDRVLSRPLSVQTPDTIVDPAQVREQVALTRTRGWSTIQSENEEGMSSIAAPIVTALDPPGVATMTISAAGPTERFSRQRLLEMVPILCDAAARISYELGGDPASLTGTRPARRASG
jgi:IclR family KDG regulon transcriptional repressor